MIIIVGASASGKTEIAKILVKKHGFERLITTTTRPMRHMEKDGVDYHFLSKDEFKRKLKNDEFIENSVYQDNYYGIQKKDVKPDSLVIVEPNGANHLLDYLKEDAFLVFVDSNKTIRKNRMISRGDDMKAIERRIASDDQIFDKKRLKRVDFHLLNHNQDLENLADLIYEKYLSKDI